MEPATQHSAILSEKLAALYQKENKPELAIKYFRQALALNPTPQTAVRLNLDLATNWRPPAGNRSLETGR